MSLQSSSRSTNCSNDGDGGPVTDGEFDLELELECEKRDGAISDRNVDLPHEHPSDCCPPRPGTRP